MSYLVCLHEEYKKPFSPNGICNVTALGVGHTPHGVVIFIRNWLDNHKTQFQLKEEINWNVAISMIESLSEESNIHEMRIGLNCIIPFDEDEEPEYYDHEIVISSIKDID